MLRLFLIFCPGIWLLDLIKIKELLRFDIVINVAQMQLKQVVALVRIQCPCSSRQEHQITSQQIRNNWFCE